MKAELEKLREANGDNRIQTQASFELKKLYKEHKDTFPAGSYIASEWEETLEGAQSRIARTEKFLGKNDEDGSEEIAEIEVPEVKVTARRKKRKKVMKKAS